MTHVKKIHQWQERLQHQKESGLTIATWCEQHQIVQSQFYYWQKKVTSSSHQSESVIVPISMPSSSVPLVIETPSGYRISINDMSVMALLPQVMKCLP